MPRYAPNKTPSEVERRYFELIRSGLSGSEASQRVGVSLNCGSLWFIDAGRAAFIDAPVSPRFLSQDDRIEIADGLARDEPVKVIAARVRPTSNPPVGSHWGDQAARAGRLSAAGRRRLLTPTYQQILAQGFTDTWPVTNPGIAGMTNAFHTEDPYGPSVPDKRIDLVLVNGHLRPVSDTLTGTSPVDGL